MRRNKHSILAGGLVTALGLALWLLLAAAVQTQGDTPASAWTRTLEPVVLTGDELWLFSNAGVDDLFVYAYNGSTWEAVPYQVDEVDASGVYTVEDGLLDANDEVVFMAMDLGEAADLGAWIADADSQNYPRYEVQVTDPLNAGQQGWAYVYRSTTLVPGPSDDYVDWNAGENQIVAATYRLAFSPTVHASVDALELNGSGVDALDRTKIRLNATCHLPFPLPPIGLMLTEEGLAGLSGFAPTVDGPVRVGSGDTEGGWWFYHSLYRTDAVLSVDDLAPPDACEQVDINWLRLSNDWLDPAVSGMAPATYYDSNTPDGVPIDGQPDVVPSTPHTTWLQVSGGQGSTVQVADITLGGGSLSNYYKDNLTVDSGDTGEDQQSFGDAGFRVDALVGQATVALLTFILGPGQPNVGATYQDYYGHPLQVAVMAQGAVHRVYLPLVFQTYE
jgi:hypothetical protein